MKPFRFGVSVWHVASRADLAEKARKIEALGYDTMSFPDHLNERIAPLPALVAAAEATSHLRVGTNVLNNDLRHPVLVAREAAAIDLLTDGRLQLGLGAGSIRSEYDQVGLRFDTGRTRVERLAEAVTLIKALLRGDEVTFSGASGCRPYHRAATGAETPSADPDRLSLRVRRISWAFPELRSVMVAPRRLTFPRGALLLSTSGCGGCARPPARRGTRIWSSMRSCSGWS